MKEFSAISFSNIVYINKLLWATAQFVFGTLSFVTYSTFFFVFYFFSDNNTITILSYNILLFLTRFKDVIIGNSNSIVLRITGSLKRCVTSLLFPNEIPGAVYFSDLELKCNYAVERNMFLLLKISNFQWKMEPKTSTSIFRWPTMNKRRYPKLFSFCTRNLLIS